MSHFVYDLLSLAHVHIFIGMLLLQYFICCCMCEDCSKNLPPFFVFLSSVQVNKSIWLQSIFWMLVLVMSVILIPISKISFSNEQNIANDQWWNQWCDSTIPMADLTTVQCMKLRGFLVDFKTSLYNIPFKLAYSIFWCSSQPCMYVFFIGMCVCVCVCFTMLNMNKYIISLMYFDATDFGVRIYALHVFL